MLFLNFAGLMALMTLRIKLEFEDKPRATIGTATSWIVDLPEALPSMVLKKSLANYMF